ncbi:uncharacterized protein K452DRAFT_299039 [Aplosporella prunicola CBS 121167]|uniref:Uncharacterized protein n=1 Tax=Aplosporella prunicola CBS 121167 TaxID=1176127 RepID=A0A6A6BCH5_9PEZI|nr:uncharacterized protein K452DRAFT_299039 [Aplosporella prunicola CBS 121167]KAF2140975.1 hypothetical protein K452DRAFT_299039 [Aplosporella prunicola CBS 121167]
MAHKRKRSDSSFSPESNSSFSRSSVSPTPAGAMDLDTPTQAHPLPAHAWGYSQANDSGRTRKRWRDNRPNEHAIHESTLKRLYNAQREHPNVAPVSSHAANSALHHHPAQRSTLHQFWSISQPPNHPVSAPPPVAPEDSRPRCDDCDALLRGNEGMDIDMDGLNAGEEFGCQHCRRAVCGTCSVQGDVRSCLNCAGVWH